MRSIPLIFLCLLSAGYYIASRTTVSFAETTTSPSTLPASVGFAPIAYFEDNCSRCHGPYGSAYGPEFGKKLSEEELTRVCDDMATGPGNAPVNAGQLKLLVDYHKAMIAKKPFVVVTKATLDKNNQILEGETTPNSAVTIGKTPAKVTGFLWTIEVPKAATYEITVKLGEAVQSIQFSP